jgi:hypothetical protein
MRYTQRLLPDGAGYPLVVLAATGLSVFQVACGPTSRGYFAPSLMVGTATVMHAVGLLLLNMVPNTTLRLILMSLSPVIGWTVMLIGSLGHLAAGAIRLQSHD